MDNGSGVHFLLLPPDIVDEVSADEETVARGGRGDGGGGTYFSGGPENYGG